ncbi:MAG: tetratricopeptide repeat protein [Sphingomicrobium sp.]
MPILILAGAGVALSAAPSVALAQAVPVYAESPADALARNVRILADSPGDFTALLSAGKASLRLGDEQAAAGFFGRAEEISPSSPLPKAGMGAALVATGDPRGALNYFARAQRLGATPASIGSDRGLAYDLLGQQVAAQTDYRAALSGPDRDEARRRLALSLAISGDKALALSTLEPLLQRRDVASHRVRALVLALAGDWVSAKTALDYTMPGTSAHMGPFFRRLPTLTSGQKAAAVHLGVFPGSGTAVASAGAAPNQDRLASIDQVLTQPSSPPPAQYSYAAPAPSAQPVKAPVQNASVSRWSLENAKSSSSDLIQTARVESAPGGKKIWLQLASGSNAADLPDQFQKIRARKPSLFDGISGFVANDNSRARLVIGPFHSDKDARLFGDALETVRIKSFRWVSEPGQVVRQLSTQ